MSRQADLNISSSLAGYCAILIPHQAIIPRLSMPRTAQTCRFTGSAPAVSFWRGLACSTEKSVCIHPYHREHFELAYPGYRFVPNRDFHCAGGVSTVLGGVSILSLMRQVIETKLRTVVWMLRNTRRSITSIAYATGFSSGANLADLCRRKLSATLGDIRRWAQAEKAIARRPANRPRPAMPPDGRPARRASLRPFCQNWHPRRPHPDWPTMPRETHRPRTCHADRFL